MARVLRMQRGPVKTSVGEKTEQEHEGIIIEQESTKSTLERTAKLVHMVLPKHNPPPPKEKSRLSKKDLCRCCKTFKRNITAESCDQKEDVYDVCENRGEGEVRFTFSVEKIDRHIILSVADRLIMEFPSGFYLC